MEKIKYGIRVVSPIKDDTTTLSFYGDSIEEVREFLRNNCTYFKFVPKNKENSKE